MQGEQEGVPCFLPNQENEGIPSEQQLRQVLEACCGTLCCGVVWRLKERGSWGEGLQGCHPQHTQPGW